MSTPAHIHAQVQDYLLEIESLKRKLDDALDLAHSRDGYIAMQNGRIERAEALLNRAAQALCGGNPAFQAEVLLAIRGRHQLEGRA